MDYHDDVDNYAIVTTGRNIAIILLGPIVMLLLIGAVTTSGMFVYVIVTGMFEILHLLLLLTIVTNFFLLYGFGEPFREAMFTPSTVTIVNDKYIVFKFLLFTIRLTPQQISSINIIPYRRVTSIYSKNYRIVISYHDGNKIKHIKYNIDLMCDSDVFIRKLATMNSSIVVAEQDKEQFLF